MDCERPRFSGAQRGTTQVTDIPTDERRVRVAVSIEGIEEEDLSFLTDVAIVNSGGTINMSPVPGKKPAGVLEEKLESLRGELEKRGIGFRIFRVFPRPPDSSNIGEEEWKVIIKTLSDINERKASISRNLRQKGVAVESGGIVVTHGTDTLQITALMTALEFSLKRLTVPIIFTASHSPIEAAGSDGLANLRKSLFVAKERFASDCNLAPTVYVVIGQDVHLASRLTKVRTMPDSDGRYFFSFPAPVGRITGDGFHLRIDEGYIRRLLPSPSASVELRERGRRPFGLVEHLVLDRFSRVAIVDDFRRRCGLYRSERRLSGRAIAAVVQGDFSSNPEFLQFGEALRSLSTDVTLFMGARKSYERLVKMGDHSRIFLLPKSMTHAKAQAKLRWLLSFELDIGTELEALLQANFAGETFDALELPEWINYETFPDNKEGTEVVVVYPNIHWRVVDDAVVRLTSAKTSKKNLFIYGFGDGHVPCANLALGDIVRKYLDDERLGNIDLQDKHSVSQVLLATASHLAQSDAQNIETYFAREYKIKLSLLRSEIFREIAGSYEKQEIDRLKSILRRVVEKRAKRGPVEIRLRNPEDALASLITSLRVKISESHLKTSVADLDLSEWNSPLSRSLQLKFGVILARRIMKDAVMSSSDLLKIIGRAVDDGISVHVRSLAVKSRSNTHNYETGNLLMILGVDSDEIPGWSTRYFLPRY
jgi:hypothetical protein